MKLDRIIAVRNNKTVFRDGELCMKVFGDGYAKSDVLNEALNQAMVEEIGLCVPKIREVTVIDGKWTIVQDFVKGKTLEQLVNENPEKKDEYLRLFVDLQLKIHSKSCPSLRRLKDWLNNNICLTDFSATVRYDLHSQLENLPKHLKLCHGDYRPDNIIITDDGTPVVIDWANASQGNASADAALTFLVFKFDGDDTGAADYLRLFCEMSATDEGYVRKWIPVIAASRLIGANQREREFLRPIAGAVKYNTDLQ